MYNVFTGFQYFLAGFELISKPGLKRFVVIPCVINLLLFIGFFLLLRHYVSEFNFWFANHLPVWLHWLSMFLWLLFFISFFLVFLYTFVTVANLIAAPFNSLLSEKVEHYLTGVLPNERGVIENIKDVPRILGRQLAILGYYLPRAIVILICFFIPLVQLIAPFLWFLFNAWFMTLTYVDYPTDNQRVPLQTVRSWLYERRFVSLGFGISVLIFTMIPILNFFAIPAAVAGATKLWIEEKNVTRGVR